MKSLFLSLALLAGTVAYSNAATTGNPTNKVVLTAAKYLMKLYKNSKNVQEITVPELKGYSLTQVALIEESASAAKTFDYVAVYQEKGSTNLKVVLYNNQNQEQLALSSVQAVSFGSEQNNSRIVLQRTSEAGVVSAEILMVPGKIQVAQKG